MRHLTEKMRKRDMAANAVLAAGLIGNLQSPQHIVRSGHIEGPGVQLMQRMMKKRKEANRNLDSGVVAQGARNRSNVSAPSARKRMAAAYDRRKKQKREKADEIIRDLRKEQKTFQDFMLECYELEEGKIPWDDKNRPLRSGWTPREKNRAKRISTGVENPEHSPSGKQLERYGKLKSAQNDQKNVKTKKDQRHKNPEDYSHGRRNFILTPDMRMPSENQKGNSDGLRRIPRNYSKGEDLYARKYGAKNDEKRDEYYKKGPKGLKEPKEEYEYELEESSTGEKMGRGKSKLTQFGNLKNTTSRRRRSIAAIAKKAGLKGTGKLSHHDIGSSPRDYDTYDSEDDLDDIGSTKQDHFIRTYKSPRRAASGEQLISKYRGGKVNPSKDSVRKVRDFKKSMTKAGANKRGRVHTVDIMHRDSEVSKGDKNQQMERGRNFIAAVKDTPNQLKKAGVKKGEAVVGKPSAVMSGEDSKTGKEKRAKLYKKIFGKRSTKKSEKTGMMVGKAD
jgi:hypothetical protein